MRVLAVILIIVAGVVWFVQRQYRPSPQKALKKLEEAKSAGKLTVRPPVTIERFEIADDFSVTAYIAQGAGPAGFSDDENASLRPCAEKICNTIGKRVSVTFDKGGQRQTISP